MTQTDLIAFLPLITLAVWALLLLLVDLWIPKEAKGWTALLAALGITLALGINLAYRSAPLTVFYGLAVVDGFSSFLNTLFLLSALAGVGLAYDYLKRMGIEKGEYYALLMFATCGMMLMASANDLITVFVALELLSIPLYILAAFAHPQTASQEAGIKYFLLGTFAAAFLLYGIALVFASTGHTGFADILLKAKSGVLSNIIFLLGAGLVLVGVAFKISIVPFHQWAPDVYQGSPTPVTGFMSIGAKAAGIAALLRIFILVFPTLSADFTPILWGLAALTMVVGNIVAVAQKNVKRLLAYSSIANGGYLLMAFVPYGNSAIQNDVLSSMLLFLAAYALASLAAWAGVIALEQGQNEGLEISAFAGLARKNPWLALPIAIAMFSYTGIPLTLGFWGKFYLFRTAVEGGFPVLAVIGVLASLASAFYYLRLVVMMYMCEGEPVVQRNFWVLLVAGVSAALLVIFGLLPGPILSLVSLAVIH